MKRPYNIPMIEPKRPLALGVFMLACIVPAQAAGTAYAEPLFEILGLPITNSIITSWVISLLIILGVRIMVGKPTLRPNRGQATFEAILEQIKGLIEPIVGRHMVYPTFWLLSGLFIYILIHNWSGLIPTVGSVGYMEDGTMVPFIRPANADLNMTLGLAIVSMVAWLYYIFRYAGPKAVFHDIFGNKADKQDVSFPMYALLSVIFLMVGFIEIISIIFRPISLSFRLYGNVFGGENLLASMTEIGVSAIDYVLPVLLPLPFYFLELLIGLIQALVFTLLVAVYIGLICNHDSEGGNESPAHT